VYLILGMYAVSFDDAHQSNFDLAATTATTIQAEQLARTGISLAMTTMGKDSSTHNLTGSLSTLGGSVVYSAVGTPSESEITSTASFNGKRVVVKAVFSFYNNRWRMTRLYIPPVA
jgi:hypothetical protein